MGTYKIDAPDSLYTIPKKYEPMDQAQIAQVYRNLLQDYAIKKKKMASAAEQKKFCDDQLESAESKKLLKALAEDAKGVTDKVRNTEKALLGKMGMELKAAQAAVVAKYTAAGDKILKPVLEKEFAASQDRMMKAMANSIKKLK